MENLVDIIQGKLSRKVSVTLQAVITNDVHGMWISVSLPVPVGCISKNGAWRSALLRKHILFTAALLGSVLYCKTLLNF